MQLGRHTHTYSILATWTVLHGSKTYSLPPFSISEVFGTASLQGGWEAGVFTTHLEIVVFIICECCTWKLRTKDSWILHFKLVLFAYTGNCFWTRWIWGQLAHLKVDGQPNPELPNTWEHSYPLSAKCTVLKCVLGLILNRKKAELMVQLSIKLVHEKAFSCITRKLSVASSCSLVWLLLWMFCLSL